MEETLRILQVAIDEVERLAKFISKKKETQVRARAECQIITATVYTWTNNHRPKLILWNGDSALSQIDTCYTTLLAFSAKQTARTKYKGTLKDIKNRLIEFRSAVLANPITEVPKNTLSVPDFSPLVSDDAMKSILHRRWNEILNCLDNDSAPLSATIMMGGVLEALLIARINKLADKKPLFKLKSVPKDKKSGKALSFSEWTLNDFIEVANEMSWIRKPARDIGKVLRDYRNLIHPERELRTGIVIEAEDAQMFFPIFTQLTNQIVSSVK